MSESRCSSVRSRHGIAAPGLPALRSQRANLEPYACGFFDKGVGSQRGELFELSPRRCNAKLAA